MCELWHGVQGHVLDLMLLTMSELFWTGSEEERGAGSPRPAPSK